MIIQRTILFTAVKLKGRMCTSPINRYKVSVPFDKLLFFGGMEDKKTINILGGQRNIYSFNTKGRPNENALQGN